VEYTGYSPQKTSLVDGRDQWIATTSSFAADLVIVADICDWCTDWWDSPSNVCHYQQFTADLV